MRDITTAAEFQDALKELTAHQQMRRNEESKLERTEKMGPTESEKIMLKMQDVLAAMRQAKPGDRSESDRRWAVSITKYEEAMAVFLYQMTFEES